ncbi:MAG: YerC/YecD family TrpR-related protein [Clostridia bacterium]
MLEEKANHDKMLVDLYKVLLSMETEEDCAMLLEDLCTFNEVNQMAQRVAAAKMLIEGHTYSQIIKDTDISSATLSRVSRCVARGSGGYAKFLGEKKSD